MKALSVRQPWADKIARGEKTIEVRTWGTRYRGPLLICASAKTCGDLPTGVAVCVVQLVDVRRITSEDAVAACCAVDPATEFAWVLSDPMPIDHAPVKGRLGLFDVASHLIPVYARKAS